MIILCHVDKPSMKYYIKIFIGNITHSDIFRANDFINIIIIVLDEKSSEKK
jgi:hypothetical protein